MRHEHEVGPLQPRGPLRILLHSSDQAQARLLHRLRPRRLLPDQVHGREPAQVRGHQGHDLLGVPAHGPGRAPLAETGRAKDLAQLHVNADGQPEGVADLYGGLHAAEERRRHDAGETAAAPLRQLARHAAHPPPPLGGQRTVEGVPLRSRGLEPAARVRRVQALTVPHHRHGDPGRRGAAGTEAVDGGAAHDRAPAAIRGRRLAHALLVRVDQGAGPRARPTS
mmetsp:Transcript_53320/g.159067  ORF Transcript_53320/g.159067 Transcript_53320/m.159067 type:complete len:224 (-) Transcript_53320:98-769(-)